MFFSHLLGNEKIVLGKTYPLQGILAEPANPIFSNDWVYLFSPFGLKVGADKKAKDNQKEDEDSAPETEAGKEYTNDPSAYCPYKTLI